jgi:DNA-binding CsgD family transcriptional regulator
VYAKDIGTDARWKDYRDIALRNGVRAIWSTPILADDNSVLGTFAMFYGEPGLPSPEHIQLIDMATQMVRVAIEVKRGENALRQSEAFLAEAQRFSQSIAGAARGYPLDDTSGDQVTETVRVPVGRGPEDLAREIPLGNHALPNADKAIESLTTKERAILRLVAEGKSNTEIAQILHLSPRTVETYRHRLMQKLNIANLPMLVKFAIRHGITKVE